MANRKPTLSREELIRFMEEQGTAFLAALKPFDGERAGRVGVTSRWSVVDLLAHMVGWQREALKRIPEIRGGDRDDRTYDVDAMNAAFVVELSPLGRAALVARLADQHLQLLALAAEVEEQWLHPETGVYQWLCNAGAEHFAEHLPRLQAWSKELGPNKS
jgi:hypothetical protein